MKTVDFCFDFSSTNSYFAAFTLPALCERKGARIKWLPIHSAALFRGTGFDVMAMTPRKARYLWRDHQRYAELTGLPFRRPSRFPIKTATALRSVLAAGRIARRESSFAETTAPIVGEYTQEVFRSYWERDEDIADPQILHALARKTGLDADRIAALSDDQSVRDELAAITQHAIDRGVFGVPTVFVGDEMFWGKDRLDFVERWLDR